MSLMTFVAVPVACFLSMFLNKNCLFFVASSSLLDYGQDYLPTESINQSINQKVCWLSVP